MEIQDYSEFYPQQEFQQYPSYSQSPETEEADEYSYAEEVAAAVSYPPRSTFGNRPSSHPSYSYPATSAPVKSSHPPVPKPRYPTAPTYRPTTLSTVAPTSNQSCRRHHVIGCEDPPTQTHHCHCQALIAVCQDCGLQDPVIADACQSSCKHDNMPVSDGLLESQPVKVLRDSGCSTVVVRRSLVPEDKLTGQEERCVLIDSTVRTTYSTVDENTST